MLYVQLLLQAAAIVGNAIEQHATISASRYFNLLEGEMEIMKDKATWRKAGSNIKNISDVAGKLGLTDNSDIAGILCLTNKRLRFQRYDDDHGYLSYPLSAIVFVKPLIRKNNLELEFSDGRKELLSVSQREDWATKILEAKNSLGEADAIERAQDGTVLDADKTTLRRNISNCFNESELRTLCFDLHIDYEIIPGSTKEEKARELIVYCEHHGLLIRLLKMCQQQRSYVKWI